MSDSLDKLFRDRELNVPPATPPPGQWALIRDRQPALEISNKRPLPFWALALALFLGLGVGVPSGAYFLGNECPAETSGEEVYAASVSGKANGGSDPAVDRLASSASLAPAAAPINSPAPASLTQPNQANYTTRSATANTLLLRPQVKQTEAFTALTEIAADVPPLPDFTRGLGEQAGDSQVKTNNGAMRATAISTLPQIEAGTVASARFGSLQSTLVSAAALTPIEPIEIRPRKLHPLTRWETGLHLTPWLSRKSIFTIQTYSETNNGSTPEQFDFGGREVDIYPLSRVNPELKRRFQINIVNLELARQFGNGLRLGIGLAWAPKSIFGLPDEQEFLNEQLQSGEWAEHYVIESQGLSMGLHVDYTFRRRRRFRPYLGFMVNTNLYSSVNLDTRLYERSSGRGETLSTSSFTSSTGFYLQRLVPRTGFQYDLSERFSVGLDIVPISYSGIGLGGRFKL